MKRIYIVRHCKAEGQPAEASLTEEGQTQALELCHFFSSVKIDRIVSSPFQRAIQTIQPLANQSHLEVELDNRLKERVLSNQNLPDWMEKLQTTYEDVHVKFAGGESSQEAMNRIVEVVLEIFNSGSENTVMVTHGNIMSLLLKHFDNEFEFEDWKKLSNPDVYVLKCENFRVKYERIWK
ncbi:histidine phosphatase family protein [Ornithinibacillus salinisoli]|uniref:Histidine phosphatase family protein n=1 Tax=Ornithinibacillus salinisoli TaxID=1848459 RepID=A0ABW4W3Z7_9BACI